MTDMTTRSPARRGLSLPVLGVSLALAACTSAPELDTTLGGPPSFYRSLASADAKLDVDAARYMISQYRSNHGLAPVAIDPVLVQAATNQARAMAAANKLDHEVRGPLDQRLAAVGARPAIAVENVSAGYHTLAEAFSGWRDSAPHNRNMLEKSARRMGIATAYAPGTKYKVFWSLVMTD
jgi:uncharacterized protein YkwD